MTDRELVARIARSPGGKAGYKQLVLELRLGGGRERRLLLEQLARLTVRGELTKIDRDHWSIPRKAANFAGGRDNLIAGRLDLHRDGYGFVRPNARQASGVTDDVFIPPNEMNGAMQGDQVLVEMEPPRADGKLSGRIARVLERRNPTVVGTFHYSRGERYPLNVVIPFDERMTQPIVIPEGQEVVEKKEDATPHRVLGAEAAVHADYADLEGLIVDVEITSWPTPFKPPVGRVIEVLGDPDDFGVDVEMMIRKHQLPRVFPENVLKEAREIALTDRAKRQKQTLRSAQDDTGSELDDKSSEFIDEAMAGRRDFRAAAYRDHRWRDGAGFRRCGVGDRARGWRLRVAGAHCRCGGVCAGGDGSGSGGAAAGDERVFSGSRDSDAAAGAVDGYLQPAAG